MAGIREGKSLGKLVVNGVKTGHDLAAVKSPHGCVQVLEHVRWRQAGAGVGTKGLADSAHEGGGSHSPAHHVTNDKRRLPGAELDDVVPITSHLSAVHTGLVVTGNDQCLGLRLDHGA